MAVLSTLAAIGAALGSAAAAAGTAAAEAATAGAGALATGAGAVGNAIGAGAEGLGLGNLLGIASGAPAVGQAAATANGLGNLMKIASFAGKMTKPTGAQPAAQAVQPMRTQAPAMRTPLYNQPMGGSNSHLSDLLMQIIMQGGR